MKIVTLGKICSTCGKEYPEMYDYCTKCGIELTKFPNRCTQINDKTVELCDLCVPIAEFLQKNFHPHTTVVIEVDSIRVEETLVGKVIEYERN